MMQFVKNAVERTPLAAMYRAGRDEWRFSRRPFADSPLGYRFVGPAQMMAGTFEGQERAELEEQLTAAEIFVDIGANVGYFTCLACSMKKHVIAIEPLSENLRYLYANLQVNGWNENVEVYPVGLAAKTGLASLYGAGTGASLVPGWAGVSRSFQRTIALSTLDILLGDRFADKRMVIKMDVEGAEYAALLGASSVMKRVPPPVWLVEITLSEHRGVNRNPHFLETFELFWRLGYTATAVGQQHRRVCRSDVCQYCDTGVEPGWITENILFSHESA